MQRKSAKNAIGISYNVIEDLSVVVTIIASLREQATYRFAAVLHSRKTRQMNKRGICVLAWVFLNVAFDDKKVTKWSVISG